MTSTAPRTSPLELPPPSTPPPIPPAQPAAAEEKKEGTSSAKSETGSASVRLLNINIVEARGLGSRDKNGGSNPFALLYDPVARKDGKSRPKMKTKIVKKSLSPVWNSEFKM